MGAGESNGNVPSTHQCFTAFVLVLVFSHHVNTCDLTWMMSADTAWPCRYCRYSLRLWLSFFCLSLIRALASTSTRTTAHTCLWGQIDCGDIWSCNVHRSFWSEHSVLSGFRTNVHVDQTGSGNWWCGKIRLAAEWASTEEVVMLTHQTEEEEEEVIFFYSRKTGNSGAGINSHSADITTALSQSEPIISADGLLDPYCVHVITNRRRAAQ